MLWKRVDLQKSNLSSDQRRQVQRRLLVRDRIRGHVWLQEK